jgi:hypothetical protein
VEGAFEKASGIGQTRELTLYDISDEVINAYKLLFP